MPDEAFMREAIAQAMLGRGGVEPNPMVGCVLVRDGVVIARGHHAKVGGPHAEPTALAAAGDARGATAYVTLEPCCHTNKRTPPCVPALLAAGVSRVVIGAIDPNPAVNGEGVRQLRAAGIDVRMGVLDAACRQLLAPFIARVLHGRAYVTVKWAESADGRVGAGTRISGQAATREVHRLRGRCDAIVVGAGTVLVDDPLLTVRDVEPMRTPRRVILDRGLRTPPTARLLHDGRGVEIHTLSDIAGPPGATIVRHAATDADTFAGAVFAGLGTHVLVEAGPTLAASLVAGRWVDRLWVIRSASPGDGPQAAAVPDWPVTGQVRFGGDVLTEYLNPRSPVFFAAEPSADLRMAGVI